MSKNKRKRYTKQQRREYNNRPHPNEEIEVVCPVLEISSWKPLSNVEDFIKNGGHIKRHGSNHPAKCKIIFPDNEPYESSKPMDRRFLGGEYPPSNLYGDEDFEYTGRWAETE